MLVTRNATETELPGGSRSRRTLAYLGTVETDRYRCSAPTGRALARPCTGQDERPRDRAPKQPDIKVDERWRLPSCSDAERHRDPAPRRLSAGQAKWLGAGEPRDGRDRPLQRPRADEAER